ncbi:MAG: YdeI/OmpD-associated family protein [Reichenbachiella sp.]|uniref:YdeI/OmpD-associated family protein n=1 Tax=Reichenbachiella sp. TaxID=2184521 RepID=UPI0032640F99
MAKPVIHPKAEVHINTYLNSVSVEQKPMLELIRNTITDVDDRIQEDWKWNAPCFNFKGLICWFVGFKHHVGLNFFKGALINDSYQAFVEDKKDTKGNRMIHYKTLSDIDPNIIQDYVKQAILLNEKNIKIQIEKPELILPEYFKIALEENEQANKVFVGFTEAQQRDYIEWLVDAKREETRNKRMVQAIEWIAEGKTRNWKYMNC